MKRGAYCANRRTCRQNLERDRRATIVTVRMVMVEIPEEQRMRWRDTKIETPPKDGGAVLAIGNEDAAIVWYDPQMGATWAVMHLPGRGVTIADTLWAFHSWVPVGEWQRDTNMRLNPKYYGRRRRAIGHGF